MRNAQDTYRIYEMRGENVTMYFIGKKGTADDAEAAAQYKRIATARTLKDAQAICPDPHYNEARA